MFPELLKYNRRANQVLIEVFVSTEKELPKAELLFSHILNAQHIWISRINNQLPIFGVWDIQPKDKFGELEEEHYEGFQKILKLSDLFLPVSYKNSLGEFTNTVSEMLFHTFNHSTYHRGQIASIFKANDITPPITDFIYLKRKGEI